MNSKRKTGHGAIVSVDDTSRGFIVILVGVSPITYSLFNDAKFGVNTAVSHLSTNSISKSYYFFIL